MAVAFTWLQRLLIATILLTLADFVYFTKHSPSYVSVERLKLALCTEIRSWIHLFGRSANMKYRTQMEEIFSFIDDLNKRLSRPIKDLDDIRLAMYALKEIRENEIKIDMNISPIEVRFPQILIAFLCFFLQNF